MILRITHSRKFEFSVGERIGICPGYEYQIEKIICTEKHGTIAITTVEASINHNHLVETIGDEE